MKNVKRFLALLLAGSLAASCLGGCGQKENKQESSQSEESSTQVSSQTDAAAESSEAEEKSGPITTDPITITILTTRHTNATNDASDLWWFKYLEYWMNEQGYNITLEVQQSLELDQQISLMLGTDSLPDLVWGPVLSTSDAVIYGAEEGMILDWTPYLNEENMPNLNKYLEENPDALLASTCNDGAVYGLPYFSARSNPSAAYSYGEVDRMYVNVDWLEECNVEMPTDIDSFLDMLRAFKNKELESGEEVIPLTSVAKFFEKYLWMCMGYYGSGLSAYGTNFSIKNGEVTLPAYTEDYRTFIEIMKICYEEGLISKDYFTLDNTTIRGFSKAGQCGVMCDYTLAHASDFSKFVFIEPFVIGDAKEVVASASACYRTNTVWASADTEYPEVLAYMLDYVFSDEGSTLYLKGPMEGEDPLNMLDGWYFNENSDATTKMVADGAIDTFERYCQQYVFPFMYVGTMVNNAAYMSNLAGEELNMTYCSFEDPITGEDVDGRILGEPDDTTVDGHWRSVTREGMEGHVTAVRLPNVYLTEEESVTAAEIKTVIDDYITVESAKFITGARPISEIDQFYEELKAMDVEEYIDIYVNAYSTYMDAVFN